MATRVSPSFFAAREADFERSRAADEGEAAVDEATVEGGSTDTGSAGAMGEGLGGAEGPTAATSGGPTGSAARGACFASSICISAGGGASVPEAPFLSQVDVAKPEPNKPTAASIAKASLAALGFRSRRERSAGTGCGAVGTSACPDGASACADGAGAAEASSGAPHRRLSSLASLCHPG